MKSFKIWSLVSAMVFSASVGSGVATATPTDSFFPWSMGGLRVSGVGATSDNDYVASFRNPDGSTRKFWPNAAGVDLCGGADSLRVSRNRVNYKEIVDALNMAGLSGRSVWVAYEPTAGVCYIKAIGISM